MPSPVDRSGRCNPSPLPTKMMSGFDGATARAPTEFAVWSSNIGFHTRPVRTLQSFAASDEDDVGIRRSDCESAYGIRRLVIEDRLPHSTIVGGLPHATVVGRHVEHSGPL